MNAPKPKTLLSVGGTAEELGVSENTVRNWIAQGKLPAIRIGERIIRIRVADLAALITRVGEQEC